MSEWNDAQCCGKCRHWDGEQAKWGWCSFKVSANVIPTSVYDIAKDSTKRTDGADCPCFAARAKSDSELCSDCPPAGYPTDKTRCDECPRLEIKR